MYICGTGQRNECTYRYGLLLSLRSIMFEFETYDFGIDYFSSRNDDCYLNGFNVVSYVKGWDFIVVEYV